MTEFLRDYDLDTTDCRSHSYDTVS